MKYVIICNMNRSKRVTNWGKTALFTQFSLARVHNAKGICLLCQKSDRAESSCKIVLLNTPVRRTSAWEYK